MTDSENIVTLPAWIRVWMPNGHIEEMKLETYLAGAVAAELSISAPLEALKAQATRINYEISPLHNSATASATIFVAARRSVKRSCSFALCAFASSSVRGPAP